MKLTSPPQGGPQGLHPVRRFADSFCVEQSFSPVSVTGGVECCSTVGGGGASQLTKRVTPTISKALAIQIRSGRSCT
jgi:hypothetical protein